MWGPIRDGGVQSGFFADKKAQRLWLQAACDVTMDWDGFDDWDWNGFKDVRNLLINKLSFGDFPSLSSNSAATSTPSSNGSGGGAGRNESRPQVAAAHNAPPTVATALPLTPTGDIILLAGSLHYTIAGNLLPKKNTPNGTFFFFGESEFISHTPCILLMRPILILAVFNSRAVWRNSSTHGLVWLEFGSARLIKLPPLMHVSKRKHSGNDEENIDLIPPKIRWTTTNQVHQVSNDMATSEPCRHYGRVPEDKETGSDDLSTGSRSDHTENEECGDFNFPLDVQNNDSSESLNDSNNKSHGIKACGAAGALECYIDISPDEDECQAQAVSQIKGSSRRAPDPKVLKTIQASSRHASQCSASISTPGSCVPHLQRRLSKQFSENGKVQIQGSPTRLPFYPPLWRDVLKFAKAKFWLYLTNMKPFPNYEEGIVKAANCILEALSMHRDANKKVEPGFQQEYKDSMAILVFKDTSRFHGELKMLARQIIKTEYDIFFLEDVGHNSRDALQYTVEHVESYLEKGTFLRDEEFDGMGHTKNIQHKAIGALVQEFYHQKKKMGQLFLNEFGESTPNPAVSLIKCCLEEWESGERTDVPFTREAFGHDSDMILDTIAKVEAHAYHGASYQDAKKEWAISGNLKSPVTILRQCWIELA
ncbi:hypothetical protein V8E52_008672 [Russula decolorans]